MIDPTIAIWLTLALMFLLLAIRVPIGFALGISGALGLIMVKSPTVAVSVMVNETFQNSYSFTLTIIPMFMLVGLFAVRARIAEYALEIAAYFTRKLPGGLGVATVIAAAGFSAVSGSSIAKVATMSKLAVPEMRRHGYPAGLATGMVAVAGTVGILIPPSTFIVIYAVITNTSVAPMLVAGLIPVAISFFGYVVYIMTIGARRVGVDKLTKREDLNFIASYESLQQEMRARAAAEGNTRRTDTGTVTTSIGLGAKTQDWRNLPWRGVIYVVVLAGVIIGGIFSGLFTPTESAAFGAVVSVIILIIERRKLGPKGLGIQIRDSLLDTAATTSMVFFIIFGSVIFSRFFVHAGVTEGIKDAVASWSLEPHITMAILLIALIPLGMFLEEMSLLLLSVPIIHPIGMSLATSFFPDAETQAGAELLMSIWLGILIIKLMEIGMVMPPVGINSFVAAGVARVRSGTVFVGILPFIVVDLVVLVILYLWPDLTLWLPSFVSDAVSAALHGTPAEITPIPAP
jgi:C4-dicarboxylate transporter DctM subunit